MKTLKRFLIVAVAALAFTACNNNDNAENMLFDWQIDENWVQSNGNFSYQNIEEFLVDTNSISCTDSYWYSEGKPYLPYCEDTDFHYGFIFTEEICYAYYTYLIPDYDIVKYARYTWSYDANTKEMTMTPVTNKDKKYTVKVVGLSDEQIVIDGYICGFGENHGLLKDGSKGLYSAHGIYPRNIMKKSTYWTLEKVLSEGIETADPNN